MPRSLSLASQNDPGLLPRAFGFALSNPVRTLSPRGRTILSSRLPETTAPSPPISWKFLLALVPDFSRQLAVFLPFCETHLLSYQTQNSSLREFLHEASAV